MPKALIIKDWSKGMADYPDTRDLDERFANNIKNYYIKPGALVKRDRGDTLTGLDIGVGVNDIVSFGEFILNDVRFILLQDGTGRDDIKKYNHTSGSIYSSTDTIGTEDALGATTTLGRPYFKMINDVIRAGRSGDSFQKEAVWYGHINRSFFNAAVSHNDFYICSAEILPPSLMTPTNANTLASPTNALTGTYFIRFTFEYDGYQEGWWQDSSLNQAVLVAPGGALVEDIQLKMSITTASFIKRITGINFYIAWNPETVGASNPTTAYYWGGRIDTNTGTIDGEEGFDADVDWSTADAGVTYDITLTLDKTGEADFPADHDLTGHVFEEELYTRLNAVVGLTDSFSLPAYLTSVYINQRQFVIRPNTELGDLPWQAEQTVLFSKLGQPDVFDPFVDFIDLSTKEGDKCTAIFSLFGDLFVLKEYNMFRIRFNNSGNSLNWSIQEHFQDIGCISTASLAVGNGKAFWAGQQHIYVFDGNKVTPLTKDSMEDTYRTDLSTSFNQFSDYDEIFGVYDVKRDRYILNIVTTDATHKAWIYDISKGSFLQEVWDGYMSGEAVPAYMTLGIDQDLMVAQTKFGGSTTSLFKLDTGGTDEADVTSDYRSNWLTLNDSNQQEKQIIDVLIRFKNVSGDKIQLKIYTDGATVASFTAATYTVSSNVEKIHRWRNVNGNNPSLSGRIFQFQVTEISGGTFATTLEIYEIEIHYRTLSTR